MWLTTAVHNCNKSLSFLFIFIFILSFFYCALQGSADPLNSAFHLTYNMVLNLLRVEEINPEYMLEKSFYQFQHYRALPGVVESKHTMAIHQPDWYLNLCCAKNSSEAVFCKINKWQTTVFDEVNQKIKTSTVLTVMTASRVWFHKDIFHVERLMNGKFMC